MTNTVANDLRVQERSPVSDEYTRKGKQKEYCEFHRVLDVEKDYTLALIEGRAKIITWEIWHKQNCIDSAISDIMGVVSEVLPDEDKLEDFLVEPSYLNRLIEDYREMQDMGAYVTYLHEDLVEATRRMLEYNKAIEPEVRFG